MLLNILFGILDIAVELYERLEFLINLLGIGALAIIIVVIFTR